MKPVISGIAASLAAGILFVTGCSKKDSPQATPPKADFNFTTPNAGLLPATVNFTSTSTNATSYSWDFGDGNTSTSPNPSNTYSVAKTYNVKLVVKGTGGTDSIAKQVVITQSKPKAAFSFALTDSGSYPTHVAFTNASTGASSYRWIFDNGDTSSQQNPTDSFFTAKTYNVKLIATNAIGSDTATKALIINFIAPKAGFTYVLLDSGNIPTHISFTNTSTRATSYKWIFGNGDTSSAQNPTDSFSYAKTYSVQLIARGPTGADTATQNITIAFNKPVAGFSYTVTTSYQLPLTITTTNTSKYATSYTWNFGDGSATSNSATPTHNYTQGGIYTITLTATNGGGNSQTTQTVRVSPYPITYTDFNGQTLNLYAWEGKTLVFCMRTPGLDPTTMFNWVKAIDNSYAYYNKATGQFPTLYTGVTYINNHVTVADVPTTCGAACSYLGTTGMEMQNTYTDQWYNIVKNGAYDQAMFYECGRNFWFYGNQLAYKTNDPITTGYAVFMRFRAMDASGLPLAPFNGSIPYSTWEPEVAGLVDTYVSNTSYTWANTLGANAGVTNSFGAGATDLFASFCMRLAKNYGDETFVENLWKYAGQQPAANTTQDAVDNFFIASCAAANKNLTTLFTSTWRWPISTAAQTKASAYPN